MIRVLVGLLLVVLCGSAMAAVEHRAQFGAVVIQGEVPRRAPGTTSGSGDTVEANCPPDPRGNDWQDARARILVFQSGKASRVFMWVKNAVPDTVFTVWVRIRGGAGWNTDVNGNAGNPLTGGGATPLAPGTSLDDLNAISPWVDPAGASSSINSFMTDHRGQARFEVVLDFSVVGGAYPFYKATAARPGFEGVPKVGYALPDPVISPGTPFQFRVVSHCTDQVSHGMSPGVREAWFQYPNP